MDSSVCSLSRRTCTHRSQDSFSLTRSRCVVHDNRLMPHAWSRASGSSRDPRSCYRISISISLSPLLTLPFHLCPHTQTGQPRITSRARRFDLLWLIGSHWILDPAERWLLVPLISYSQISFSLNTEFWTHWAQHASAQGPLPAERLTNHVNGALLHCATDVNAQELKIENKLMRAAWCVRHSACCVPLRSCTQLSALRACCVMSFRF